MENSNHVGNKRVPETSAESLNASKRKIKKKNVKQNSLTSITSDGVEFPQSNSAGLSDKMTNIAKLRQQFIQEIKDIELASKETIKNLRRKISEANNKNEYMDEKLREANQILCSQAQMIYEKEHEYESLREKVKEFYEYQKILIVNMEDISDTLNGLGNLSAKLEDQYEAILMAQANQIKLLEKELEDVFPDEHLCKEIEKINLEIAEYQKGILENDNKAKELESELKKRELQEEKDIQELAKLDKEASEIESRTELIKQKYTKENSDLMKDIENLDKEIVLKDEESVNLDKKIAELKDQLEKNRNLESEIQKKIKEVNDEIDLLLKENQQLDEVQYNENQQNSIQIEKLEEELKIAQAELESDKKKHNQAINLMDKKIGDLKEKVKTFDAIKVKIEKYEVEISKEEDSIKKINEQIELKKSETNDELKSMNSKFLALKKKKNDAESNLSKLEKQIKQFEKEKIDLSEKLKIQLSKQNSKQQSSNKKFSHYGLPFTLEDGGMTAKKSNNKASYNTPMMGSDDLEIDELPIEEQFSRLTQTSSSNSERGKKFFKHSSTPQKPRKDGTPRGRGRGKKF